MDPGAVGLSCAVVLKITHRDGVMITQSATPQRSEIAVAGPVLILGALLRFWQPGALGVDHYDEGVYVLSAMGLGDASLPWRMFPDQIFFAPPLYVIITALAHAVSGVALDTVAMLVSALFGTLTVALVWWVGRRWFTPAAGIAAASLLALSDFHIAMSRSALTDATFLFFFLLATALIVRALESGGVITALLAGAATGLAWNTKYHGWMALTVGGAGYALIASQRVKEGRWRRDLVTWLVTAATAVALYLPWALYVASLPGGYARLTAHQRLFLESDWQTNLWMQVQRQGYLDGRLNDVSILLAAAGALFVSGRRGLSVRSIVALGILTVVCWFFGGWVVVLGLAVCGLMLAWNAKQPGAAMAIAWFALFVALTPLYRPYARLFLPLTLIGCLLAGNCLARLAASRRATGRSDLEAIALVVAAALLFVAIGSHGRLADTWRPSRGLAEMAETIASKIPRGSRVKVIEEPPLAFYLHRLGFDTLRDVAGIAVPATGSEQVYVVTGPYGQEGSLERLGDRVESLGDFRVPVKDLRMVDDVDPPYDTEASRRHEHEFHLYAVTP